MKTPLYLINGPLGAGKTTFLKHLLTTEAFQSARVIENEFASTSVDTAQLHDHTAEVQTIAGLCICCSTGDELTAALTQLSTSTDPVIIEATGVANSLQLIEKIVVADMLEHYEIAQAFFVLDAVEAHANTHETIATYRQELQAADVVHLSKTDLLDEESRTNLMSELQEVAITQLVLLREGVPDEPIQHTGSGILMYFAELDEAIVSHDGGTNYTVIDVSSLAINPSSLDDVWSKLRDTFGLKRMKGNFRDTNGTQHHVEATPAQCRVSAYIDGQESLVFIGAQARELTISDIEAAL